MQQSLKTTGGKKIRAARSKIEPTKYYPVLEAISQLKQIAFTKFDQTLELIVRLGVDPRHSDQMVRGMITLPAGTGKTLRVAVICREDKVELARDAGADLAGSTEIIEDIKAGKIAFDVCIATPDMMGLIGQVAKILGPKGLMPNPKLGTVTQDITFAVSNAKSGQVEFRVEKNGIVHAGIGKLSFSDTSLLQNVQALVRAVSKAKPSGAKGTYMQAIFLASTMGPAFKIDPTTIQL